MKIQEHISLKELTTMKIGGTARYFCVAETEQELKEAFAFSEEKDVPVLILGGGSNVLIASGELSALVIKIDLKGVVWDEDGESTLVIAGAGESWDGLVAQAVERGLWGIENLSGIPGSVGATPIQNIGAYGAEIKDVVEWVEVFDTKTGKVKKLRKDVCQFSYRDSLFKKPEGKSLIVLRVALRLKKNGTPNLEYKDLQKYFYGESHSLLYPPKDGSASGGKGSTRVFVGEGFKSSGLDDSATSFKKGGIPTLAEVRDAVLSIRTGKFPDLKTHGTAGSFFKNPIISKEKFDELKRRYPELPGFELPTTNSKLPTIKVPLAWILDNLCGLKGYSKGSVKLFEKQPIVLVHSGSASSGEVEMFAKEIMERVKEKTGIEIEWEVALMK
ncbi:MAG: UDP-N-acetylmuramate dehydrogenase [bacterium]|nr:UDP-N-acetylmuramate dehydrogenase [bacterium]